MFKMITCSFTNIGKNSHYELPDVMKWEICSICPRHFNHNLNLRKQSDKSSWRNVPQDNWSELFKNITVLEDRTNGQKEGKKERREGGREGGKITQSAYGLRVLRHVFNTLGRLRLCFSPHFLLAQSLQICQRWELKAFLSLFWACPQICAIPGPSYPQEHVGAFQSAFPLKHLIP